MRPFRRDIRLAHVEKVRVQEAGKLPFYGLIKHKGIGAADRLPFDCMAWFAVSAVE